MRSVFSLVLFTFSSLSSHFFDLVDAASGWFYFTYYTDTACTSVRNYLGYPTDYCFTEQSTSYRFTCLTGSPTILYYDDPNCQFGTRSQTFPTSCGSKQQFSCTSSANLPFSTGTAIVYNYKESTCINPISFEAFLNGYCDSTTSTKYSYPYINYYTYSDCSTLSRQENLAVCSNGKRMELGTSPSQNTIMPTRAPTPTPIPLTIQGSINIAKFTVSFYSVSDQAALNSGFTKAIAQILQIDSKYITNLYFNQLTFDSTSFTGSNAVFAVYFILTGNNEYFSSRFNSTSTTAKIVALLDKNSGRDLMGLAVDLTAFYGASSTCVNDLDFSVYQRSKATVNTPTINPTKSPTTKASSSSSGSSSTIGVIIGSVLPAGIFFIGVIGVIVYRARLRSNAQVIPGSLNALAGTSYPFNNRNNTTGIPSSAIPGASSNPYTALGAGTSSNPYSFNPYTTTTFPLGGQGGGGYSHLTNNNNGTNQPITVDFAGGLSGMSSSIPQQQPYNPSSTGYGAKPYDPSFASSAFSSSAYGSSAPIGGGGGGGYVLPYSNLGAGNPANASASSAGGISMVPTSYGNGASSYNAGNTSSNTGNAYGGGGLGLSSNLQTASAVNYNTGVPDTFAIQTSPREF